MSRSSLTKLFVLALGLAPAGCEHAVLQGAMSHKHSEYAAPCFGLPKSLFSSEGAACNSGDGEFMGLYLQSTYDCPKNLTFSSTKVTVRQSATEKVRQILKNDSEFQDLIYPHEYETMRHTLVNTLPSRLKKMYYSCIRPVHCSEMIWGQTQLQPGVDLCCYVHQGETFTISTKSTNHVTYLSVYSFMSLRHTSTSEILLDDGLAAAENSSSIFETIIHRARKIFRLTSFTFDALRAGRAIVTFKFSRGWIPSLPHYHKTYISIL